MQATHISSLKRLNKNNMYKRAKNQSISFFRFPVFLQVKGQHSALYTRTHLKQKKTLVLTLLIIIKQINPHNPIPESCDQKHKYGLKSESDRRTDKTNNDKARDRRTVIKPYLGINADEGLSPVVKLLLQRNDDDLHVLHRFLTDKRCHLKKDGMESNET